MCARRPNRFLAGVSSLALLLGAASCDRSETTPAGSGPTPSTHPSASPSTPDRSEGRVSYSGEPKQGWVVGKAVTRSGNPLSGVRISVGGTTIGNGERAHFQTTTKADGTYELRVPHGLYTVSAKVLAQYNGRSYLLPLHAADNTFDDADSDAGIVEDFVWQISGLKPNQTPGTTAPEHYYGARLDLKDRNSYEERVGFSADGGPGSRRDARRHVFPPKTVLTITLVPDGTLIDGSPARRSPTGWR